MTAINPDRPVIPPRKKPAKKTRTEAEKASRAISQEQRRAKQASLDESICTYHKEQQQKIADLAKLHSLGEEKVRDLVGYYSHYKKSRKASLHNTINHFKAMAINENLPIGKKKRLTELQALARQDPDLWALTHEEEERLVANLEEFRQTKITGLRANNNAAARDFVCTTDNMIRELDNLAEHTGAYGFFFCTRGHVNDTSEPTWYSTHNSMQFVEDVLKLEPDNIAMRYKQWACSKEENLDERDTLGDLRKQCVKIILKGLRFIKNNRKLEMEYVNYEKMVQVLKVALIGWPKTVKFASPSLIGTVGEMKVLRDNLKSGKCHWQKQTAAQLVARLTELEANGQTLTKKRKTRSDAGRPRNGKENAKPAQKKHKTATTVARPASPSDTGSGSDSE
ncbi:hypothetical protein HWV62_35594 [Athelia sp. TMB]|nr:hypothetical protein HWV62_35594 [Athelia sp. TMB]